MYLNCLFGESQNLKRHNMDNTFIKILIVDDEAELCELIKNLLKSHSKDIQCSKCFSAHDALEKLRYDNFHIVITDIKMPKVNGLELIKAIKNEFNPSPLIYSTTGFSEHEKNVLLQAGSIEHFKKPEDLEKMVFTIISSVNNLLNK